MSFGTTPCDALLYRSESCHWVHYYAIRYPDIRRVIVPFDALLYHSTARHSMCYYTIRHPVIWHVIVLFDTLSFDALLFYVEILGSTGKENWLKNFVLRNMQISPSNILLTWGLGGMEMVHYATWKKAKVLLGQWIEDYKSSTKKYLLT
ncbi:unnamed protein product [Prunus armeniaca]|uniref:Uncharacterized protein n=1 Tax=Prunus armeniaca TaxID=36596 RepID=A0A6J5TWL4_PRUAR|nr:unnamed protein product [Prunus armeniaca]